MLGCSLAMAAVLEGEAASRSHGVRPFLPGGLLGAAHQHSLQAPLDRKQGQIINIHPN